jgi:regulation of enolase protein 1 (concanavalin A-like superfamily)
MFDQCSWLNEPKAWRLEDDVLHVTTDQGTDFWLETHYGFTRHSGHIFGVTRDGDFTAQVRVRARYEQLYDQAGLMVRIDEAHWVKAGIELSDGRPLLSSVLTVEQSDWATGSFTGNSGDFWMRATVANGVLRLQCSPDGKSWPLVRLCPFPRAATYMVGPMCCTPERAGLEVRFSDLEVTAPLGKDLHDLS